jgi:hypothetical protein
MIGPPFKLYQYLCPAHMVPAIIYIFDGGGEKPLNPPESYGKHCFGQRPQ